MIGYVYIEQLFRNILKASSGIQGRLVVCSQKGIEINSDDLYQAIKDDLTIRPEKKYPIALLMFNTTHGSVKSVFEDELITMFFLKQIGRAGVRQIDHPNNTTRTSNHTIVEDWHDMKRCAKAFMLQLDKIIRKYRLFEEVVVIGNDGKFRITPISGVGTDVLAGVRLDFSLSLKDKSCDPSEVTESDYGENHANEIQLPSTDAHPMHQL